MTQEEYEQEQREIERLINEINATIEENNRMIEEINYALANINVLQNNIAQVNNDVVPVIRGLEGKVEVNSTNTQIVLKAMQELSAQYFTFKELSTASKNLSRYTSEYYERFSFYNNLRRITLGYVIGLDANFVTSENMRKMVEKVYLENTEYWLAYATMAVMLWASDEQEAAERALQKALSISPQKAALYFMLINLRFGRNDIAQEWFVDYMNRVNPSDLGEEWQYLLQAYLEGAFGDDGAFQKEVGRYFQRMLSQTEATTVNFSKRFIDRAYQYEDAYLHITQENFAYLQETCVDYPVMIETLSNAEKNELIAKYYDDLLHEEDKRGIDVYQRIENVLYSLVNEYDTDELEVVKKIKYNEHVMSAQGDTAAAQKKFNMEFGKPKPKNFADLLTDWAFTEDSALTPLNVRRFSVTYMKDWICKGYEKFAENNRAKEKHAYAFNIDGCQMNLTENDVEQGKEDLAAYYEKNKWKNVLSDHFIQIYGLIAIGGLAMLIIMFVQLFRGHFSPEALVMGVLLIALGAFLLWRQIIEVLAQLKERQRLSVQKLEHALTELGEWRTIFHRADEKIADLEAALRAFGNKNKGEM